MELPPHPHPASSPNGEGGTGGRRLSSLDPGRSWEGLHRIAGVPPRGRGCCARLGHIWVLGSKGSWSVWDPPGKHDPPLGGFSPLHSWGALYTQVYGTQIRNAGEFMPV